MRRLAVMILVLGLAGCSSRRSKPEDDRPPRPAPAGPVVISVVGTNDLHGHIEALPLLGGYLANLRAARAEAGGGVLLVDGGDMFQGTLESNLAEGAPVVDAYRALGYHAVTIGNHEFDFGPVGPAVTATEPGQDARGALRARAAEAPYPFLMANVVDAETGERPDWKNVFDHQLVEIAGAKIGVVGVTTMSTPHTTMPANFAGLAMRPIADEIALSVRELRAAGAVAIVVAAHAGGSCESFDDPSDHASCDTNDEIFEVARALTPGTVDVIVAGHTHRGMAHRINGVAVIESYAYGRAFGRVDLTVDRSGVTAVDIHEPRNLCRDYEDDPETCDTDLYEGVRVTRDAALRKRLEPAFAAARARKSEKLGVTIPRTIERSYREPSALGNLFADLMLAAAPKADIALTNGGGLRADLPAGELTYGQLYTSSPFDNRLALVKLTGAQMAQVLAVNLGRSSGIFSIAGLRAVARCRGDQLEVSLTRPDGTPVRADEPLVLATSDFIASGGDGVIGKLGLPDGAITVDDDSNIRDAMADVLRARGGSIDADSLLDPAKPRIVFPGKRPVRCP